jgi:hypothetical protein
MIPTKNRATVESTLPGERHNFTINLDGGHIMSVLSNLYSRREEAVLRELSTNARDAHINIGNPDPIHVTLPSALDARLIVRDYGCGLTVDDITGIFTQFGASTKRDNNDEQGCLGLGSKSPFTYTNSFTFTSIRDGVKVIAALSLSDEMPVLTVVDTSATDELSGSEVVVPCTQGSHWKFADIAARFYKWWPKGSVLVNGKEPERVDGMPIGDDMLVIHGGQDYIIMGGVAYPCERMEHGLPHDKSLAAFVPNGSIEFVPSREALKYTKKTRDYIKVIEDKYTKNIEQAVEDAIKNAATPRDAISTMMEWHKLSSKMTWPKYKGRDLPKAIDGPFQMAGYSKPSYGRGLGVDSRDTLDVSFVPDALFVYNYDVNFTTAHRTRLQEWCNKNGVNPKHFILSLANHSKNFWLKDAKHVDWEEVKRTTAKPSTGGGGGWNTKDGPKGSYDEVWTKAGYKEYVEAKDINTKKPIYYVTKYTNGGNYEFVAKLLTEASDCTVVFLTKNRITKFTRDFPKAKDPKVRIQAIFDNKVKKLTPADMNGELIDSTYGLREKLKRLDAKKIDDPAVVEAIEAVAGTGAKRYNEYKTLYRNLRYYVNVSNVKPPQGDFKNPLKKYTIIEQLSYYEMDRCLTDLYLYMNAKYKENK